jgi:thiol-disulfide isomerase/thioredoxin
MRRVLPVLFVVVAMWAGQSWPALAADDNFLPKDKRPNAPKLSLKDMDGEKRQLSDLKGKIVVVNFWATWCGACKAEMPAFTKVQQEYKDRGVEFIGAANEPSKDKEKVREFVQKHEIQFPIWMEASITHLNAFKVGPGLPATAIVDQSGRVAARIKGETDEVELRSIIDKLLAEVTPAPAAGGR